MRENSVRSGLLVLGVLFISVALVPSACMAGPLGGVLVIDNPTIASEGASPEFCNNVPAGTLVTIPQEARESINRQIITDEELIHMFTTQSTYPGADKSVVVITNESETTDSLSVSASAENGIIITRSPFTTAGTLLALLATAPDASVDSAASAVQYISADGASIAGPEDCPFDDNDANRNPGVPVVGSSQFNSAGFVVSPASMSGTQYSTDGFSLPVNQVVLPATSAMTFTTLPLSSSPLAPFSPSVQPGGHIEAQFGTGPSSDFSYHESQSADGVINGFSYQAEFTAS